MLFKKIDNGKEKKVELIENADLRNPFMRRPLPDEALDRKTKIVKEMSDRAKTLKDNTNGGSILVCRSKIRSIYVNIKKMKKYKDELQKKLKAVSDEEKRGNVSETQGHNAERHKINIAIVQLEKRIANAENKLNQIVMLLENKQNITEVKSGFSFALKLEESESEDAISMDVNVGNSHSQTDNTNSKKQEPNGCNSSFQAINNSSKNQIPNDNNNCLQGSNTSSKKQAPSDSEEDSNGIAGNATNNSAQHLTPEELRKKIIRFSGEKHER